MPNEKYDDWPTFDSVFRELSPNTLTARERLANSGAVAVNDSSQSSLEVVEVLEVGSLTGSEAQATVEPLTDEADPVFEGETLPNSEIHDEYGLVDDVLDLDNPDPEDFVGDTDVPFSSSEGTDEELTLEEDLVADEPTSSIDPTRDHDASIDEVGIDDTSADDTSADDTSADDADGWVNHSSHDIAATEPVIESSAPMMPVAEDVTDVPAPPAPSMDMSGLVEAEDHEVEPIAISGPEFLDDTPAPPVEKPAMAAPSIETATPHSAPDDQPSDIWSLVDETGPGTDSPAADITTTGPDTQNDADNTAADTTTGPDTPNDAENTAAADTTTGPDTPTDAEDTDPWQELRAKKEPEKITFWENRPKFFGGDERRRAKARRDSLAASENEPAELPKDLPCPKCGQLSDADLRDPQDGRVHIRCESCSHIWSIAGR